MKGTTALKTLMSRAGRAFAAAFALGLLASFAAPPARGDDGWTIAAFDVDAAIGADAGLDVVETVDADFEVPKHGILREIPIRYAVGVHQYSLRFRLLGVDDGEGRSYPTSVSYESNLVRIRIGSPDYEVQGRNRYRIRYHVQRAVLWEGNQAWADGGRAVLRWNATGTEWQVPIAQSKVTVHLPRDLDDSQVSYDAWVGRFGVSGRDFRKRRVDARTIEYETGRLAAREGITVEVTMPADAVARPGPARRLGWWLMDNFPYVVFPITAALCFLTWFARGRDLAGMGTIVVGYEPPDGLTPAEVGTLVDEQVDMKDVSATIIDLAVRGYLRIEDVPRSGWFSSGADTRFVKIREPKGLKMFEKMLFDRIFRDGDQVLLSDLREKFYPVLPVVTNYLYEILTRDRYFDGNPQSVRTGFLVGGLVAVAAAVGLTAVIQLVILSRIFVFPVIVALILSALTVVATSRYMSRKTRKGRIAWEKIAGLEEYIRRAEVDDIREQERQGIFERLLPYAIIFGLSDRWGKAFADLYRQPPDWYRPADPGNFSTWVLVNDMDRSMWSMNRTFPTQPRSTGGGSSGRGAGYNWSSGGFGGGGSSGGGFGGGGGSSW
ncbi:DUF2207 domain-containing protein [Planctomyces sp. SH-PL62]|uniref:DUF2207 domain-containing protein n=1 Tax=Planctomyces sp. SH-PL62 TaxID=1636152 RepID=UPI00078C66DE|nr:DUF2207 domain-containing protein [Planctomyces sp. SH-PL62]AMV40287.1 hypothetical protein VT85_22845 [Planctomyces sp. SH-PL62]